MLYKVAMEVIIPQYKTAIISHWYLLVFKIIIIIIWANQPG